MSQAIVKKESQLTFKLDNVPGTLGKVADALKTAGVSIEGICYTEISARSQTANLVVDKADIAKKTLEAMGMSVAMGNIVSLEFSEDRPGIIASVAHVLGDAGVNIENIYTAASGVGKPAKFYVAVANADFEKALKLAQGM